MAEYPIKSWEMGFLAGLANPQPLVPLFPAIAFLFSGKQLPKLPSVPSDYPYLVMLQYDDQAREGLEYKILAFSVPIYKSDYYDTWQFSGANAKYVSYTVYPGEGETKWKVSNSGNFPNGQRCVAGLATDGLFWTNHDIRRVVNGVATDEIYMEKSADPIPVYE